MQDYTHLDAWIHILNRVWYHINLVKIIDTHAVCAHNALLATFCSLLGELSQKRNKRVCNNVHSVTRKHTKTTPQLSVEV